MDRYRKWYKRLSLVAVGTAVWAAGLGGAAEPAPGRLTQQPPPAVTPPSTQPPPSVTPPTTAPTTDQTPPATDPFAAVGAAQATPGLPAAAANLGTAVDARAPTNSVDPTGASVALAGGQAS